MWSTVVLSTGLVLLLGCTVAGTFLLRKQLRNGLTSFGVIATSDSVLSTLIGLVLVGLALFKENFGKSKLCGRSMMIADASTFLLSFVNSFVSMLLMAIECWINGKTQLVNEATVRYSNRKRRLTVELVAQWILPILSIVILHQLTPKNSMVTVTKLETPNNTCNIMNIFPIQMASECQEETIIVENNQQTSNLTFSVVQRIYELVNGSVNDPRDTVNHYSLTKPQTKEEWKKMFMQLQMEPGQEFKRKGKEGPDFNTCDETCLLSFQRAQTYFVGLLLLIYLVPMIGTVMLHRSTKLRNRYRNAKLIQDSQDLNVNEAGVDKVCHLEEVKMMTLSNFIMWTPTIIERLVKKLMCSNPPQWLVAILFIIGQLNTVIRGIINANIGSTEKPLNKNVIVPLDSKLEAGTQELPHHSTDKTEALFQKRAKIP